jgi:hypothetical protein
MKSQRSGVAAICSYCNAAVTQITRKVTDEQGRAKADSLSE